MKLELRRVRLATPGVRDARRAWSERESLLVRFTSADGTFGVGEASPLPGYSHDTLDDAEAALRRLEPTEVERALAEPSLRGALRALTALLPREVPSARLAVESVALDWLGKRRELPAPALLGAEPVARRPLAALLGPAAAPTLFEQAERALEQGFRCLKLKLGEPGRLEHELAAVRALRERLGSHVHLRLDANGALGSAELEAAWPRLKAADIELFEEPGALPSGLLGELPLGLDESLQGVPASELEALLRRTRASHVVLKPTALGGLEHCWQLAERAARVGVGVVISHCFDGPFAWRAAAALALALPAGAAHGLAPHAGLTAWHPAPPPVHHGALESWTEPGLGSPAPDGFA